jgi:putative peptide zinc metalloprotease protein
MITFSVLGALVLVFFTVPLPVSRVYAEGVIEVRPDHVEPVYVRLATDESQRAILRELFVADGKRVRERDPLARFENLDLERELTRASGEVSALQKRLDALRKERQDANEKDQQQYDREIGEVEKQLASAIVRAGGIKVRLDEETVVRAPRDGMVMGLPTIEAVGRRWDRKTPLCRVGDPEYLRVLIPVPPADYSLLQENLGYEGKYMLPVEARVHGQGTDVWKGYVSRLPESEAATIPVALSNRANGPVPIKPSNNPEELIPQTQQYLVSVDLDRDQELTIKPGARSQVKIHCKKRTLAWWVWRTIHDTFNLGFL